MKALDLKGCIFGELTALRPTRIEGKRGWVCECSCGKTRDVTTTQLRAGYTKTCGDNLKHRSLVQVGDRFGKLVVEHLYLSETSKRYLTVCLCDCGNFKSNASVRNLQRGVTKHCGCSVDYSNFGLPEGVAIFNTLYNSYRYGAKSKNLEFKLSKDECSKLFQGNCYFCGDEPYRVFTKNKIKGSYTYSGIDRTDSTLGYITENVVSCCTTCNFLKSNTSNEYFLSHVEKIYKNRIGCEGVEV